MKAFTSTRPTFNRLRHFLEEYVHHDGETTGPELARLDECLEDVSPQDILWSLATIRSLDRLSWTVFHRGAYNNHFEMIKRLLNPLEPRQRCEILCIQDIYGQSPFHIVAFYGREQIAKHILNLLSSDELWELIRLQTNEEATAVHYAGLSGQTAIMRHMLVGLTLRKTFELFQIQSRQGITAISGAICNDHTETVRCMLNSVAPNSRYKLLTIRLGKRHSTALHYAAVKGYTETTKCMFELIPPKDHVKVMWKQDRSGRTPMHFAMWRGQTETVRYMLTLPQTDNNYLPSLLKKKDQFRNTPIQYAIRVSHTETVKCALEFLDQFTTKTQSDRTNSEVGTASEVTSHEEIAEPLSQHCTADKTPQAQTQGQEGSRKPPVDLDESVVIEDRQLEVETQRITASEELQEHLQSKLREKTEDIKKNAQQIEQMGNQLEELKNNMKERDQKFAELEATHEREIRHIKRKIKELRGQEGGNQGEGKKLRLLDEVERRQDSTNQQVATLEERAEEYGGRIAIAELTNQSTREGLASFSRRVEDLEENVVYRAVPIGGHEQPAGEFQPIMEEMAEEEAEEHDW